MSIQTNFTAADMLGSAAHKNATSAPAPAKPVAKVKAKVEKPVEVIPVVEEAAHSNEEIVVEVPEVDSTVVED